MAKFDVPLNIIVEASDAEQAFAMVRSHFCVVEDREGRIKTNLYDMHVGEVTQLDDNADISDYA
jgi:hypothetical protein